MATRIASVLGWLPSDDDGQGLAEYALILALIVLAIIALLFLGSQIRTGSAKSGTPSNDRRHRRSRRHCGLIEGPAGPTVRRVSSCPANAHRTLQRAWIPPVTYQRV